MKIELKLSGAQDAHVIKNLWPLYQHDVSQFDGGAPNRHGLFGAADSTTEMLQHLDGMDPWWKEPDALIPYLIWVDGCPAGFNLVAARSRLPKGIDVDFVVHEFFVLHAYRGKGVAERAATEGFDRHRGSWEVVTYPSHSRGIAFWRKAIRNYSSGAFSEASVDHVWGRKVAFTFDNSQEEPGATG